MEKIKCDIIQDLIPSYVDEVCSDATRECVEEHLESCEQCRNMVALCRKNGISGGQADQKELDGLKKIRQFIQYKGYACCGLVILNLGYMGISILGVGSWYFLSFSAHLIMFVTCMCLVLLSGMGFKGKKRPGWQELAVGGVAVLTTLYMVALETYFVMEILGGADTVFGLEMYKTGPFLTWQMGLGHLALLGIFLYHLVRVIKKDKNCNWLLCLDVAGCFIVSKCYYTLCNMSTPEKFMHDFVGEVAAVAVIGLAGVVASVLLAKIRRPAV